MTKIAGFGSESGSESGSSSQRHVSEDPDPDPPKNVTDLQHWLDYLKNQHHFLKIQQSEQRKSTDLLEAPSPVEEVIILKRASD
jgi:hypothetical protein